MESFFLQVVQKLAAAQIESPRLETRLMFAEVLHRLPSEIFQDITITEEEKKKVEDMLEQRLKHKPLDKILGHKEFYKYEFKVTEDVLSPRQDTEILVESALEILQNISKAYILDLGCGSGCIIESLLKDLPSARGCAVDISDKALILAAENADNLEISERICFLNASWFDTDFIIKIGEKFDMIVSNPPYIPSADIDTLDTEVKEYDPRLALDGGENGYDSYAQIARIAPRLLQDGGYVLLEAGIGQAEKIADIFIANGLRLRKIVNDLSGIARCVILQKAVAENKNS
ncbi:MAG: peptide chain release factor N(5)-glutamine methyltransferase [Alphaproteobacteria bacterium]|nr:peptide chain release factor N(5)-glutamine methyltransferase [Alphaproteobacteria bacterium]